METLTSNLLDNKVKTDIFTNQIPFKTLKFESEYTNLIELNEEKKSITHSKDSIFDINSFIDIPPSLNIPQVTDNDVTLYNNHSFDQLNRNINYTRKYSGQEDINEDGKDSYNKNFQNKFISEKNNFNKNEYWNNFTNMEEFNVPIKYNSLNYQVNNHIENYLTGVKKGRHNKNTIFTLKTKLIHVKTFGDNIRRKIKTHFHKFILEFLNECIKKEYTGKTHDKLKDISHEYTKNVSIEFNKRILSSKIIDLFKQSVVSKKYSKITDEDRKIYNEKVCEKISSIPDLKKLLDLPYKTFYEELFINCNTKIIPEKYIDCLNKSTYLNKVLIKINKEKPEYLKKFETYCREKFVQFFLNSKPRRTRLPVVNK